MKLTEKQARIFRDGWGEVEAFCDYSMGLGKQVKELIRRDSGRRPAVNTSRFLVMRRLVHWYDLEKVGQVIDLCWRNITDKEADFAALAIWLNVSHERIEEAMPAIRGAVQAWNEEIDRRCDRI